jgi:SpoVK/Ycf46/Vps4 family AAA+-type ATPase
MIELTKNHNASKTIETGDDSEDIIRFKVKKVFGRRAESQYSGKLTDGFDYEGKEKTSKIAEDRPLGYQFNEIGSPVNKKPFENLAYPEPVQLFKSEIQRWYDSKEWHAKKGIPWRFGAGLFGPPGTGKSSMARALAQEFDMPIHIYDLTTMDNEELVKAWKDSLVEAPCMVLFEDLDRIFDENKNIKKTGDKQKGITLDCLLNCINGVEPSEGILVLVTANDVTKLDTALGVPDENGNSTRPGRLDKCVYFGPLEEAQRAIIAKRILEDCPHHIEKTIKDGEGETGAQFENRCAKLALSHFWGETPKIYQ